MDDIIGSPTSRKEKWALVARFGGLGDVLIASSILPGLKARGLKVAFLCVKEMAEVLEHDPHIDRLISIDKLPEKTASIVDFFKAMSLVYDEVYHLSETIERMLLFRRDTLQFYWPDKARRAFADRNYLELVHEFADVPPPYRPAFYPTQQEADQAKAYVENWGGGRVIAIQAMGSNFDKIYPFMDVVIGKLMTIPDVRIMVLANGRREHEVKFCESIDRHVTDQVGRTDRLRFALNKGLRWAMCFARQANVLLGPDTGMMWSVASATHVRKVVLLSHASPRNITDHWQSTTTLHADQAAVSCWPCHKLHDDMSTCRIDASTKSAACISNLTPRSVVGAVLSSLKEH